VGSRQDLAQGQLLDLLPQDVAKLLQRRHGRAAARRFQAEAALQQLHVPARHGGVLQVRRKIGLRTDITELLRAESIAYGGTGATNVLPCSDCLGAQHASGVHKQHARSCALGGLATAAWQATNIGAG
jgi:hypothetical protein